MNFTDVEQICVAAQVDPRVWSIGSEVHEALCAIPNGQQWTVFSSERGERFNEKTFLSEDDASVYFLKRLFALWKPESQTARGAGQGA